MQYAFKTDVGQARPHNEDNGGVFVRDNMVLAIVADGMGGHQAGDVASCMTKTILEEKWQQTEEITIPTVAEDWIIDKVHIVNDQLFQHSQENKECQGMGTTVVAAICTNQFITIAHIGDSRGYLLNNNGFVQITEDHSLVNELVRKGQITDEEAENHPRKNVLLRALGTEQQITVDVKTIDWDPGNYLLLCSDGLSNKLIDEEINDILLSEKSIDEKVNEFITIANERGGEDNITVAVVHYTSADEEARCMK
ncbi:Stp1/IreP family PP2C-type Ser/Thr phosphatase [Bacillus alkalicellulosilyticus]|uniref:Stp1/IreP family PP2C-type Ser/Thr phosphatase n=1 Tax=Alkalihalobacterium alkalicellulosilyticum TaxID=1912214 RepID=UPI00099672E7|nr:Stp1/IreP family PP2C-type Ser/Thr phosphatase [Bacillus alkalicellulosilyticus]